MYLIWGVNSLQVIYRLPSVFPGSTSGKELSCQYRRHKRHWFDPWVRKIPWRRAWQPTPVFLPGELHGQRSQVGYSAWGCKELDTTEATQHAGMGFPGGTMVKNLPTNAEDTRDVGSTPGSRKWLPTQVLSGKFPWAEEPGGLQSMGLQRIRHE